MAAGAAALSLAAFMTLTASRATLAQGASQITVTGCVEKDAASSTPVFKLVVPPPNAKIYRLNAPKEIDVASHVGHTVDVSGMVTERQGSREAELAVSKLTMVRDSCPSAWPR
jgi:hypothetical protein